MRPNFSCAKVARAKPNAGNGYAGNNNADADGRDEQRWHAFDGAGIGHQSESGIGGDENVFMARAWMEFDVSWAGIYQRCAADGAARGG